MIGLIDVDGHNFPNLCLMKISAYYKNLGTQVEWWSPEREHYDVVYMSKVFSDAYSPDIPTPTNADTVVKGGTGYAIKLEDGKEVYHKEFDPPTARNRKRISRLQFVSRVHGIWIKA